MDTLPGSTLNVTFGPGQSKVFLSKARIIAALGGPRGGKTTVGAYWAQQKMFQMVEDITPRGIFTVPSKGIIAAPTFDILRDSTLPVFFNEFPILERYYRKTDRMIKIPVGQTMEIVNGREKKVPLYSIIYLRSMQEYVQFNGLKSWWIWLDEPDGGDRNAWPIIQQRIKDTRGQILLTSTIYNDSWINGTLYKPYLDGKLPDVEFISWPSLENPAWSVEEWEKTKRETDPIAFARMYEGKFVFEAGLVFGDILKYGIVERIPEGVEVLATFYGIDYGINDPTVILVVVYCSDRNFYVVHETVSEKGSPMDTDQINMQLQFNLDVLSKDYGFPTATYFDPHGGVATLSLLPEVVPLPADKDIPKGITLTRNYIFQKRIFVLSSCEKTRKELSIYSYLPEKNMPMDKYNHTMDALRYIVYNAYSHVEWLAPKAPRRIKSRVELDAETRGLLKDGIFQTTVNMDEYI